MGASTASGLHVHPGDAHAASAEAVLAAVGSDRDGLTSAEAAARLERWGPNEIPMGHGPRLWVRFLRQFTSPLIYVLVLAAGLSAWLGEWADAGFIAVVLLVNAAIATTQEHRAAHEAAALRQMVTTTTDVVRDGDVVEVDAREVVVGDVVLLASGMKVPADLRILDSDGIRIDESPLTGESVPVHKDAHAAVAPSAPVADRPTMAHAGTLVGRGRGRGVVTATGSDTELGALAEELRTPSLAEPPLVTRMRRFTMVVAIAVAAAALALGAIELSRGTAWPEVVMVGVALAVSAIPESLPIALTVALAVVVRRMARRHVIVRRLVALESLGSCTVIASDKTGTLTVNELTVSHVAVPGAEPWAVTGIGVDPTGTVEVGEEEGAEQRRTTAERLARGGVLCNEATVASTDGRWVHRGDAVDVALLVLGHKIGLTRPRALAERPELAALPFESEHRYAASLHSLPGAEGTAEIVVKGAPEQVLAMCTTMATPAGERPIDADGLAAVAERLATDGERVLALASRRVPREPGHPGDLARADLGGMVFLGLVGMSDPLRADSPAAVQACRDAGITVVMVTGDHPSTALAIARQLGLAAGPDEVVTGSALHDAVARGEAAVDALTRRARVFARVAPAEKHAIVASLIRRGHVVAVTGDGANDAPALHHAHVGIAMGRSGTDVAREAGEIVLTDDRFGSIAAGVEEGRIAYANLRKVIQLLISTGAAELLLVLVAVVVGLPLPLVAVQLLWLNLVTNGIQDLVLAFEPGEGDEMRRPPRSPREPIFDRLMIERVLLSAAVMGGVTLATFAWVRAAGWGIDESRNTAILLMVLFENVHTFNSRSETRSVLRHGLRGNRLLVIGTVGAQLAHIGAMHLPLTQSLLGLSPVSPEHWALLLGLALTLLVAVELHKLRWRRLLVQPDRPDRPDQPSQVDSGSHS